MGRARIHKPSIFQGKLQFPAPRGAFSLYAEHPLERDIFRVLIAVLFILVVSYVYFVSNSVLNVIARKQALLQGAQIGTSIGGYEREYFAISQLVRPDSGASLGLLPVASTAYAYRPGAVGQAVNPHNEI